MPTIETGSANQPIGLYKHRESGTFIGAIDQTQANAFHNLGYDLAKEGHDAAMMTEEQIAEKFGGAKSPVEAEIVSSQPEQKKGK